MTQAKKKPAPVYEWSQFETGALVYFHPIIGLKHDGRTYVFEYCVGRDNAGELLALIRHPIYGRKVVNMRALTEVEQ